MRLLLVNPRVPPSFWSMSDVGDLTGAVGMMPSLALATVAALTPEGFDVRIHDEAAGPVDLDEPCDVVGLTGYVTQHHRIRELAQGFRARGRTVVIGGPHASLAPDRYRDVADVLVLGEAEEVWPEAAADLLAGRARDRYEGDRIDLTASPAPRNELLDTAGFYMGSVQTSRGCPFECEFCDVIVYLDRRQRHKTPEQVVAELADLYRRGVRDVFLCDDNLTAHRGRSARILDAVAEWNAAQDEPVRLITQVSIDIARDQDTPLLERAWRAGLRLAFVGLETSSPEALTEAKKHQNVRQDLVGDIHKVQRQGIQVQSGLVCGFDADDLTSFRRQFEFMQAAGTPNVAVTVLAAPEGTPLETRLRAAGRLDDDHAEGKVELAAGLWTNVLPLQMSREQVVEGAVWLMNALYTPEAFLERVAVLASCLPDADVDPDVDPVFPGDLLDTWRRVRRGFRDLGPDYAGIPRQATRLLKGKEPVHLATALIWFYNTVRLLQRWDVWAPHTAPYPEATGTSVQVGPAR